MIISITQPSAAVFSYSMSAADTNGSKKIIADWNICTKSTDCNARAKSNHQYTLQSNKSWSAMVLL